MITFFISMAIAVFIFALLALVLGWRDSRMHRHSKDGSCGSGHSCQCGGQFIASKKQRTE